ncbi:phage tail sheath C-terminal domain-containing protein [Streptomyces sp. NPDC002588]|uniref:phage tail sheath C-terminal domain-containing protein n=1 Tax=Streptomyces sp. NPDC002588 TaxID=3154419 RepID=UPI0033302E0D
MPASILAFQGRLPGVGLGPAPPAADSPLGLDVAAFVGFAQQGPVDLPVAVEDHNQFTALFGGELVLATDSGQLVYAHLSSTVRAFFDNGGRRCYVVRVAGPDARPARFPVPGVRIWQPDGGVTGAFVEAAWPGAWSDGIRIGTQSLTRPLAPAGVYRRATPTTPGRLVLRAAPVAPVQPGDLIRLGLGPGLPQVYTRVRELAPATSTVIMDIEMPYAAGSGPEAEDQPRPGALDDLPAELAVTSAELLRMDLVVRQLEPDGSRLLDRQSDLAFNSAGSPSPGAVTRTRRPVWTQVLQPAGDPVPDSARPLVLREDSGSASAAATGLVVPVGMDPPGVITDATGLGADDPGDPAATAGTDDLGTFPAGAFVDPALAGATVYDLVANAAQLTVLSRQPRRLAGIHALLDIDEVALVAVPDATHPGWSPGTSQQPDPGPPVLDDPAGYDESGLVDVQTALVTMCAARGDLVALLSVPAHYDAGQVLGWRQRLATGGRLSDAGSSGTSPLSYAGYWYPWLRVLETDPRTPAPLRAIPPDGMVAGTIAARELARGAWVAPANLPLRGPLQLVPALTAAETGRLFDAHANVLRRRPGAVTALSAHTLSDDPALLQLSVRRLLILLRRTALTQGRRYSFETDNDQFRRLVRNGFERILASMAAGGAIRAFQVTAADEDDGTVVVTLRIAPTDPVEFITISLVRSGEGLLDVREG